MVLSGQQDELAPPAPVRAVRWHDLECGSYHADLALWRELAARGDGPLLDIGAGSGRVTLDLARAGHAVIALDLDGDLLAALAERARGLTVSVVRGDARSMTLERADLALAIMPMQTVQLLGGADARVEMMCRARVHLRRGGLLACAIVTDIDPFDVARGDEGPSVESSRADGLTYMSRASSVGVRRSSIRIERERVILAERSGGTIVVHRESNVIELDRVSAAELAGEAERAGLHASEILHIGETHDHVGSEVVILSA